MTKRKQFGPDNPGKPFAIGNTPPGRMKGSRNKLSADFVDALRVTFEQYGIEAMRISVIERPTEFLKIIASVLPKEFEINDNRLAGIPDHELDAFIELARRRLASVGKSNEREEPTLN
jgi:hypothetical protein